MATGPYNQILPQAAAKLKLGLLDAFQATVEEAAGRMIDRVPVKTGRAKASIYVVANSSDAPVTEETDPDGGSTKARAAADAKKLEIGDSANITSNLPYIELLENGSSEKAPEGFMKVTRVEVQGIFDRQVKERLS